MCVPDSFVITLSIYIKDMEEPRYLVTFSREEFYVLVVHRDSTLYPKMGLLGAVVRHDNKIVRLKRIP